MRYTLPGPADSARADRVGVRPERSGDLSLTCPNCGNAENFLVKTLQMHLLRVAEGQLQPPLEEGRPALVELLCDECDSTLDLDALDEDTRRELMVTLGVR